MPTEANAAPSQTKSILDDIFAYKRLEVARRMELKPLQEVRAEAKDARPALDFVAEIAGRGGRSLLHTGRPGPWPALIAEVKRASPSRGILSRDFDPLRLAQVYRENGAVAISVLTDEHFFGGSLAYLEAIASLQLAGAGTRLPLLRKDFLFDPYQVYEARAAGADAILLIAASLAPELLQELYGLASELGMAALVEIHTAAQLESILPVRPRLVGINNRDLHTFTTRLETTLDLRPFIPAGVMVVSESGIHTVEDVALLAAAGIDAILVGEGLLAAPNVAQKVRELSGNG